MTRIKRTKHGAVCVTTKNNIIKIKRLPVVYVSPTHAG